MIDVEDWVNRVADGNVAYYISDKGNGWSEWGPGDDSAGFGYCVEDGDILNGGNGGGEGYGYGAGVGYGNADGHDTEMGGEYFLPVSCAEGPRTTRVFLCAGCIGGYECSIHGRRL